MKGSEWIQQLKRQHPGPGLPPSETGMSPRDQAILDAVKQGHAVLDWYPVTLRKGNTSATFLVTNAMQIGEPGDSVRVSMSQSGAQRVADQLNATLPSQGLADQMYAQADHAVFPPSRKITSTTQAMHEQSDKLDRLFAGKKGLLANEGKFWLNHSKLVTEPMQDGVPAAVNYGWFLTKPLDYGHNYPTTVPNILALQGPYTGHGIHHVDYSQLVYLVARPVLVCEPVPVAGAAIDDVGSEQYSGWPCTLPDGSPGTILEIDIYDMIQDPAYRDFLIDGDPGLELMRHPKIPWESGTVAAYDPKWPVDPPGDFPPAPPEEPPVIPGDPSPAQAQVGGKLLAAAGGLAAGWLGLKWMLDRMGGRG